jgi:hypothetical protein
MGPLEKPMKLMLLNDTATVPHVGCQAVSDGHALIVNAVFEANPSALGTGTVRAAPWLKSIV